MSDAPTPPPASAGDYAEQVKKPVDATAPVAAPDGLERLWMRSNQLAGESGGTIVDPKTGEDAVGTAAIAEAADASKNIPEANTKPSGLELVGKGILGDKIALPPAESYVQSALAAKNAVAPTKPVEDKLLTHRLTVSEDAPRGVDVYGDRMSGTQELAHQVKMTSLFGKDWELVDETKRARLLSDTPSVNRILQKSTEEMIRLGNIELKDPTGRTAALLNDESFVMRHGESLVRESFEAESRGEGRDWAEANLLHNYVNLRCFLLFGLKHDKEYEEIESAVKPKMDWVAKALAFGHGGLTVVKTSDIKGSGISYNRLKSVVETAERSNDYVTKTNAESRTAYSYVLSEFKKGNYVPEERAVVEELANQYHNNHDSFTVDFLRGHSDINDKLGSLGPIGRFDLALRIHHKVYNPKENPKELRWRHLQHDNDTGNSQQLDRPMTIDDLNLDAVKDDGSVDSRGITGVQDYIESSKFVGLVSMLGSGGSHVSGIASAYGPQSILDNLETKNEEVRKGLLRDYGNAKVNPAIFFEDERGKGAFKEAVGAGEAYFKTAAAAGYNYVVSPVEQKLTGAYSLGELLLYNTSPNSAFFGMKSFLSANTTVEEKMGFLASSFIAKHKAEDMAKGDYHPFVELALSTPLTSDQTKQSIISEMRNFGFATEASAESGLMAVHPALIAGKMVASGGTLLRSARVSKILRTANVITEARLDKVIKFSASAADLAMMAPVRVAAYTVGYGGRALIMSAGGVLRGVAKLGGAIAERGGLSSSATAVTAIENAMKYIGISNAFVTGGFSRKFAMAFGVAKVAEAGGLTVGQYFKIGGYGFRGVMATAAADSTLPMLAQRVTSALADKGMVGAVTWDVAKGMAAGAGVGFSLEYMNGDLRRGMDGVWGGMGMGGMGAGIHSVGSWWTGATHANLAREMIEKRTELIAPELKAELLSKLNDAQERGDHNFSTGLIGAMERLDSIGAKLVLTNEEGMKNNPELRDDLHSLSVAEKTVGGKTYRFTEIKQAIEDAQREISRVSADATLTPEEKSTQIKDLKNNIHKSGIDYHLEVTSYLDAVGKTGDVDLIARVDAGRIAARGVHIVDREGQKFVFLNLTRMTGTTSHHEAYHAIKNEIVKTIMQKHIATSVFGIKLRGHDSQGNPSEATYQKELLDGDDIKDFATIYYTKKHANDPVLRDEMIRRAHEAADEIKAVGGKGVISDNSAKNLTNMAEEFGASWFEHFIKRKPLDAFYRANKYSKIQTVLNRAEMYLKHNTTLDANAIGIRTNLKREVGRSALERERYDRSAEIRRQFNDNSDRINFLRSNGKADTDPVLDWHLKKAEELRTKFTESLHSGTEADTSNIDRLFYAADGSHLIVPDVERHLNEVLGTEGDKGGQLSTTLDMSGMSGPMLEGHLKSLGLEHWGYRDSAGTVRLKDKNQIQQEGVKRGERMFEEIGKMDPAVSGVVITKDNFGNLRMSGMLTDQALQILGGQTVDFNGRLEPVMLPSDMLKYQATRDAIKNGMNDPASPKGNNVMQMLYSGLSVEKDNGDGTWSKIAKPRGFVEQTFRRILPYRLEFVLTTKDSEGNKVAPHFEPMVTAVDLAVIYRRMADEMPKKYTLPSGGVVEVASLFGDMNGLHNAVKLYLDNLSNNNPDPSAEIFGGGEVGAAKRDILHRILGTIPSGGVDMNGRPMYKNNPLIKPFDVAERGPNFAFTTFRLDLMSQVETLNQRVPFTEDTYQRSQVNYSPPSEQGTVTSKGVNGDIKTTKLLGKIELKDGKNVDSIYDIVSVGGRFIVRSPHVNKDTEYSFASREQALDFVNLDHNRLQAKLNNAIGATINYNLRGYVVSHIDGKYVILDGFGGNKKVDKASYNQVGTTTYSSYSEALRAAAAMHNAKVTENLRADPNTSDSLKRLISMQIAGLQKGSKEALPSRVEVDADGNADYEQATNSNGDPVFYDAKDDMVKQGHAKAGDPIYKINIQKVDYALTKALTGRSKLPQTDPSLKRAATKISKHLTSFILDSIENPDIAKGYTWYRDFSTRGYQAFGSLFPLFCEALGATSARTDVDSNFKQAIEFLRMYSNGDYNKQINTIVERLKAQGDKYGEELAEGETMNGWHKKHLNLVRGNAALKELTKEFPSFKRYSIEQLILGDPKVPKNMMDKFQTLFAEKLKRGPTLTENQIAEAKDREEADILASADTLMFKKDGSKYNMNTAKVTMVAVGKFFERSVGPKTPQFAKNLMARDNNATIDVWAMRTLHRIANSNILKNDIWRIPANQESGVKGEYKNEGTIELPNMVGHGDFFLGQEAFQQTLDALKTEYGDKFGGKFADMTPADLQALAWFAEKHHYEQMGWTDTTGAQKASFEGPLERLSGPEDSAQERKFTHVVRMLVGLSAENNTERVVYASNGQKIEPIKLRSSAIPIHVQNELLSNLRDAYGKSIVGLTVRPTLGKFGDLTEFSIHIETSLEQGDNITLSNKIADTMGLLNNAKALMGQYERTKANATSSEELADVNEKIRSKQKEIQKLNGVLADQNAKYKGDNSQPILSPHFSHLVETVINYGRRYQQESVMAHEIVGANHPNARPARQVWFKRTLNGHEANAMVEAVLKASDGNTGFTLTPDPVNVNNGQIDIKSRSIDRLQKRSRDPNISEAERKSIGKQIDTLTHDVIGLMKFSGMYNVCVPEFAGSKTVVEAKDVMTDYNRNTDTVLSDTLGNHPDILKVEPFYTNSVVINAGGYDTTNVVESGKEADLGFHLQRYQNSNERLQEQKASLQSQHETGDSTSPVWPTTATERGAVTNGPESGGSDAQQQASSGNASLGRFSEANARDWLQSRKAAVNTSLAGGAMYGDKSLQVTQRRGTDGKLTNRYQVHDIEARKVMEFRGQAEAEKYVLDRLTGSRKPDGGPRTIERGGKVYEAVESAVAVPERAGLEAGKTKGVYGADEPILDYSPDEVKDATEKVERLSRVTQEQEERYNAAMAAGDKDAMKRIVMQVAEGLGYTEGWRGSSGRNPDRRTFEGPATGFVGKTRNSLMAGWVSKSIQLATQFAKMTSREYGTDKSRADYPQGKVHHLGVSGPIFNPTDFSHVNKIEQLIQNDPNLDKVGRADAFELLAKLREDGNFNRYEDNVFQLAKYVKEAGFSGYLEREGDYPKLPTLYDHAGDSPIKQSLKYLINMGVVDGRAIKSLDAITYAEDGSVVPLSQRFDPTKNDINYSPAMDADGFDLDPEGKFKKGKPISPEEDAEYMRAVQAGDEKKMRELVNMARRRSEYGGIVYHRVVQGNINEKAKWKKLREGSSRDNTRRTSAAWAWDNRGSTDNWNPYHANRQIHRLTVRGELFNAERSDHVEKIEALYQRDLAKIAEQVKQIEKRILKKESEFGPEPRPDQDPDHQKMWSLETARDEITMEWENVQKDSNYGYFEWGNSQKRPWIRQVLEEAGFTGHHEQEGAKTIRPDGSRHLRGVAIHKIKDFKFLDTVTYDEDGNPIPISKRFDPTNENPNYSPDDKPASSPNGPKYLLPEQERRGFKVMSTESERVITSDNVHEQYGLHFIPARYAGLSKDEAIGMQVIQKLMYEDGGTWPRHKELRDAAKGDFNTIIRDFEATTGRKFYDVIRSYVNRNTETASGLYGVNGHGYGLANLSQGAMRATLHEYQNGVLRDMIDWLEKSKSTDGKFGGWDSVDKNDLQTHGRAVVLQDTHGQLAESLEQIIKQNNNNSQDYAGRTNFNAFNVLHRDIITAAREIMRFNMDKAGVSKEDQTKYFEKILPALSETFTQSYRSDPAKQKEILGMLDGINEVCPELRKLISVNLVDSYNDARAGLGDISVDFLSGKSADNDKRSNNPDMVAKVKDAIKKSGKFTDAELAIIDQGFDRLGGATREESPDVKARQEAGVRRAEEEGLIIPLKDGEFYHGNSNITSHLDHVPSRELVTVGEAIRYIEDKINDRRLDNMEKLRSSERNYGGKTIDNEYGEAINDNNYRTRTLVDRADVEKHNKVLKGIQQKLVEMHNGAAYEAQKRREPYADVIKKRVASGELKSIKDLFAELKSYGVNRVSIEQLMELTKMSTDSNPVDMASGIDSTGSTNSDKTDFQLLQFVHALSGINTESSPDNVNVIDPDVRGHAQHIDEFRTSADRGRYLFRTDGDMRTILEELHHSLVHQNPAYKALHLTEGQAFGTGAEFKKAFKATLLTLESNLSEPHGDLSIALGDTAAPQHNPSVRPLTAGGTGHYVTANGVHYTSADYPAAYRMEAAGRAVSTMALCTLGRLWMQSFDAPVKMFGFGEYAYNRGVRLADRNLADFDGPASNHTFDPNASNTSKGMGDVRFLGEHRFYPDKSSVSQKDYGFKSLIEFAAHALNDRHIQSILAQQKPIVNFDGNEPVEAIIKELGKSKDKGVRDYSQKLRDIFSSIKDALSQLYAVLKISIQFGQTGNHSGQGPEGKHAQKYAVDNQADIQSKRTALEQAIEASALVRARTPAVQPVDFPSTNIGMKGTGPLPSDMVPATKTPSKNAPFREDLLKYLGRVKK